MWRPYRPLTVQCHEDYRGDREAGPARPFSLNPGPHSDAGWGRWQFGVYARLHEAPVAPHKRGWHLNNTPNPRRPGVRCTTSASVCTS